MTITTTPVAPGTAEQLARLSHFRGLEHTQPEELDAVAYFLIGDVGGAMRAATLWQQLCEHDAAQLWHLITDDWDEFDLDEIPEAEWARSAFATQQQEIERRYEITRDRLTHEIEHAVHLARWDAFKAKQSALRREHKADVEARIHPVDAAMRRHPAGSRLPAHLTGSNRPGGGNPLGDYLHLKGEGR